MENSDYKGCKRGEEMKKWYKILVSSIVVLVIIIGYKYFDQPNEIAIYQLSNQSYSQMMSYIIECEGTTVVIDGGTSEDKDNLIQEVKNISKDNKVEAWFITHYHKDHTGALASYLMSGTNDIEIESVYYNFPKLSWIEKNEINRYQDAEIIINALKSYSNKITVKQDMNIDINDIHVQVLRTYNSQITENAGNNSSSVFKFDVYGNSILFLGDLGVEGGEELIQLNKKAIMGIDYVQMAHHGQSGVNEDVYQIINPKYCLWPTTDWLWKNEDHYYKTDETKAWMKRLNVKKNYIANESTTRIPLEKRTS